MLWKLIFGLLGPLAIIGAIYLWVYSRGHEAATVEQKAQQAHTVATVVKPAQAKLDTQERAIAAQLPARVITITKTKERIVHDIQTAPSDDIADADWAAGIDSLRNQAAAAHAASGAEHPSGPNPAGTLPAHPTTA